MIINLRFTHFSYLHHSSEHDGRHNRCKNVHVSWLSNKWKNMSAFAPLLTKDFRSGGVNVRLVFSLQWRLYVFWSGASRFLSGRRNKGRHGGMQPNVGFVWRVAERLHREVPGGLDHIQVGVYVLADLIFFNFHPYHVFSFSPKIFCFSRNYRSKTYLFEEFLFTWQDKLRKLEQPTAISVKLQGEVDKYKVLSSTVKRIIVKKNKKVLSFFVFFTKNYVYTKRLKNTFLHRWALCADWSSNHGMPFKS